MNAERPRGNVVKALTLIHLAARGLLWFTWSLTVAKYALAGLLILLILIK